VERQESADTRAPQSVVRPPRRRRGRLIFTVGVALSLLTAGTVVTAYALDSDPGTYSFFANTDVSRVGTDYDNQPVELGLRFTSRSAGTLQAVRFLKARGDQGAHPVTVWSSDGRKLATGTPGRESRSGWQQVKLSQPVHIDAGRQYTVSYHTSRYASSNNWFAGRPAKAGPLTTVGAGVYAYGPGGFPTQTWESSNYWVDVVFSPSSSAPPTPPSPAQSTTSPTPSASVTTAPPPATTTPPPAQSVLDLPRVAWEGGPSYYGKFATANADGWTNPSFFPIGVWYESVITQDDVDKDKAAGLNTYVMLTDTSDMSLIKKNGMYAMTAESRKDSGSETTSWLINDEVDMWGGAGDSTWTGKYPGDGLPCTSGEYDCGYDIMKKLSAALPSNDGRMKYANFGKGVIFWQSDADAAKFVNDYTSVVSNDIYWYTDPDVCDSESQGPRLGVTKANCRRAANYGLTMDRMRALDAMDGKRQPIYAFVEDGHPFTDNSTPTITGDQIAGAAMNSLIHEARGILYFNHNFGGSCTSQHVLRDSCGAAVRPAVTELNRRITSLAPVLNTQSYQWQFNSQLDTMLKAADGSYYIFAMPGRTGGTGQQTLTLPKGLTGASAQVLFENRTVPITGGTITDTFAKEFTYHVYKITP
jgi:hypothetical protein